MKRERMAALVMVLIAVIFILIGYLVQTPLPIHYALLSVGGFMLGYFGLTALFG